MKWEEQSKEMVGTFIHKFTSPAIEQLLHTGKERIYRYNMTGQIFRKSSVSLFMLFSDLFKYIF